jgi:hypothetical protein
MSADILLTETVRDRAEKEVRMLIYLQLLSVMIDFIPLQAKSIFE